MLEVLGKGRGKDVEFVIGGQADFKAPGVEHEGGIGKESVFFAVDWVAKNGAAEVGHVDAQLMGAACAGIEGDEGVALGRSGLLGGAAPRKALGRFGGAGGPGAGAGCGGAGSGDGAARRRGGWDRRFGTGRGSAGSGIGAR
ncbi:hypothetical protein SPIROBIBN47_180045 [uncultured spirochete]|uniref:Uncharacterized protein n=1 Tax=uncultured spirochete TaxID=156406 RepID=A0A3P3XGW8_9SPIR|nr:hypothetical protein SPIROBIBN47_180045 [uncultured spirochete]